MSLPNYLAKIKSAGIYRFVWDKSQITSTEAETLRLVVGYSEKGPFNTPVYIDNAGDFKTTFGDINKKLERRGVFFHRMALQALAKGPILAFNVKKFGVDSSNHEKVSYVSANPTTTFSTPAKVDVEKVYNTSRFWSLDADNLPGNVGSTQYITIASTDSKAASNSIFMRGYNPTGYDVTLKTWYSTNTTEEMPSYMEGYEDMNVSDFFAEIYVFKGEFTKAVATSEELEKYFDVDSKGNVVLKPYITNAFGEKVDTLSALADNECSNFVQCYRGIILPYFKGSNGSYISLDLLFNQDTSVHKMLMKIDNSMLEDETITLDKVSTRGWDNIVLKDVENMVAYAQSGTAYDSTISSFSNTNIKPGVLYGTYQDSEKSWSYEGANYLNGDPDLYMYLYPGSFSLDTYDSELDIDKLDSGTPSGVGTIAVSEEFGSAGFSVGDRFIVQDNTTNELKVSTLAKMTEVRKDGTLVGYKLTFTDSNVRGVITSSKTYLIIRCANITTNSIATMSPLYVEGYTMATAAIKPASNSVEDKLKWQKSILNAISTDSSVGYPGLVEALTNRTDVDYRYIVDTFESFVESELKSTLSLLAKKKDNCLLLTNFPSIQTFVKSKAAKFTDENDQFQMKYVKAGANTKKNPSVLFSLPSIDNGASWCSFNTPVVFTDGTVKTTVPAAALVSNNFMEKYESRQPYYIVAGPTYGSLQATGLVGPDHNFSRDDLDILEPMGVNATVYQPRQGVFINSNQTAKQTPVSALSKINVRELVIYLQDQIEDLLQSYQWEFNTAALRELIKTKADSICENIMLNGGIEKYENVCDTTNNTPDVINNEFIVLSTSIEPGLGCGKMVQELTIYKRGGMSSTVSNG